MSATQWSGPYCHAEDVTGERLAWDPLANGRAPRPAVRYVVRWRVSGFANPRKRTFPDAGAGKDFAARIAAAKVLAAPCGARGWPMLAAPERPSAPSSPTESPAEPDGLQFDEPRVPAPDGLAPVEPAPVGPQSADTRFGRADAPGSEPIVSGHAGPGRGGPGGGGPGGDGLDPSVKQYLDELTRAYRPYWEQTNQAQWWLDQLAFVDFALRYEAGDERLARFGLQAGESLHFSLLSERDFNHALDLRRTTNLRVAHHNRQRQQRYERLLGEYETKLAAWQARSGRKGRRPAPPPPPGAEPEFSRDKVLISANAENRFRTAMSFVFDRAFDAGLFPAGPNPYRQWSPRAAADGRPPGAARFARSNGTPRRRGTIPGSVSSSTSATRWRGAARRSRQASEPGSATASSR